MKLVGLVFVLGNMLFAQGIITTVAGTDWVFPFPMPAPRQAPLGSPLSVTSDTAGNLYFVDQANAMVFRIASGGELTVVAGNGIAQGQGAGDGGPATRAPLDQPTCVAVDTAGVLWIGEISGRIRQVDRTGTISTRIADFRLFGMKSITVDRGGRLFVSAGSAIYQLPPGGALSLVAGGAGATGRDDGIPAIQARLAAPEGLTLDSVGNLYFADFANPQIVENRVRRIGTDGRISTIAGNRQQGVPIEASPANSQPLYIAHAVAVDSRNVVYIADANQVRRVSADGRISTIAGLFDTGYEGDGGRATQARFNSIRSITVTPMGEIVVTDFGNARIRKISSDIVTTIAGNGQYRNNITGEVAGTTAVLNYPNDALATPDGALLVSASEAGHVLRVSPEGTVVRVAGNLTGAAGTEGGPATEQRLWRPCQLALDRQGNLFIVECSGHRVRKVTPDGRMTTVAGGGQRGFTEGARATEINIDSPCGIAVDAANNLYVADGSVLGQAIYRVSPEGRISIHARAERGWFTDSGFGCGIALDSDLNLYVPDYWGNRIRRVSPSGSISTLVGVGASNGNLQAPIAGPTAIWIDRANNIFLSGGRGGRIDKVSREGMLSTIAGPGRTGFPGDGGPAIEAYVAEPRGLSTDSEGNLFVADFRAHRIRKVLASRPRLGISGNALEFVALADGSPAVAKTVLATAGINGVPFTVDVRSEDQLGWLRVMPVSGSLPRLIEVQADPENLAPGDYSATLSVRSLHTDPGEVILSVRFRVEPGAPPRIEADKPQLSFNYPARAVRRSQPLQLFNRGSGRIDVTVEAETRSFPSWLQALQRTVSVGPREPATVLVEADPAGFSPGTYSGAIRLSWEGGTLSIPVTMTVSNRDRAILLSQSGLSFTAVAGGGVVPPQELAILNLGASPVGWTVSTATLAGGSAWLSATPNQGTTGGAEDPASRVVASVNANGLAPGRYYGLIRAEAADAANSPQVVVVCLDVLAPDSNPGAVIQPIEISFNGTVNPNPGSEELMVYNLTPRPITFRASTHSPGFRFLLLPTDATVRPSTPQRVLLQPGQSIGPEAPVSTTVVFQFSDGSVRSVYVRLRESPEAGPKRQTANPAADGCVASALVPTLRSLGQAPTTPGGWPVAMVIGVMDNCGSPLVAGSVIATFSNGDPAVQLQSLRNGRWHGTWATRGGSSQVRIRIEALEPSRKLAGVREVDANLRGSELPPVVDAAAIGSSIGAVPFSPLGIGAMIAIRGERLADADHSVELTSRFPLELGGSRVIFAGRPMPLQSSTPGRIQAMVPYEVEPNTTQQLLVQRGFTYSIPVAVNVAQALPAIVPDPEGQTNVLAWLVKRSGQVEMQRVSPTTRVRSGDEVLLYCSGLGLVRPQLEAGTPSPDPPPAVATPVTVYFGSHATAVTNASLVAGLVAVYQVRFTIPDGLAGSNGQVSISLEVAGQRSAEGFLPFE